jgi:hypothetical protein
VCEARPAPTSSVRESDTCVAEFGWRLMSGPYYGPRPWSSPRSGMRAEALAIRPAGQDRGPGRPGESHGPGGRTFDPLVVLGHLECQQEVGPLGTPSPWTRQLPYGGLG